MPGTSGLNTVEVDGRTWLRVVTNTGDKVHLVAAVDGTEGDGHARALPAWGAHVATLESSSSESSRRALAELREHFKAYPAAEKRHWWIETRCGRPWSHMATASDEAELSPGTVGFFGGLRSGDRACSKCGTPEYGDVPPTVWTPELLRRIEAAAQDSLRASSRAPSGAPGGPRSRPTRTPRRGR